MPFITQGKTNWKFLLIVIVLAAVVVGFSCWLSKNIFIEGPLIKPTKPDEKYCEKDSDCVLNYTGSETCPSCLSDDYQCVSLEYYNKVFWPEWEKNHKGILCEGCPMVTEKIQCVCEKNLCKKIVKDVTADWKTYRNEKWGFEIRYPNNFEQMGGGFDESEGLTAFCNLETSPIKCYSFGVDKVSDTEKKLGNKALIIDFLDLQCSRADMKLDQNTISWKPIKMGEIDGLQAISTNGCGKAFSPFSEVIRGDTRYFFWAEEGIPLEEYNGILSTIKFFGPEIRSYTACGCGCCGGVDSKEVCLYISKGDDIQKIIDDDKKAAQNPDCPKMGCSIPIKYTYCD